MLRGDLFIPMEHPVDRDIFAVVRDSLEKDSVRVSAWGSFSKELMVQVT